MTVLQGVRRLLSTVVARLWIDGAAPIVLGLWIIGAGFLSVRRHTLFETNVFDLGYYTQVLWNTSHGSWFANSLKHPSFLADHFSPILLLIAPIFWFFPDARVLLVVEAIALGASIVPLYFILRSAYPALAPLLVIGFVLNVTLHRVASEDFHEIMLAAPALALVVFAVYHRQTVLFAVASIITLLIREDMGLYVAIIGLSLIVRPRPQWRLGLMALAGGVSWAACLMLIVIPAIRHESYAHFPAPASLVGSPLSLTSQLLSTDRLWAVLAVLIPLAGLPLLARENQIIWLLPVLMLVALPVSNVGALRAWYVAPVLPLVWGTIAMTLARWRSARWVAVALSALIVSASVSFRSWSPFPGGPQFVMAAYKITPHVRVGEAMLKVIPDDARVVAQTNLGPHLATRPYLKLFPWFERDGEPQWVVFDQTYPGTYPLTADELHAAVKELRREPNNRVVFDKDGYLAMIIDAGRQPVR